MLKFKNIQIIVFTLFVANFSFGQKGTQSPYSSYGLGERNAEGYATYSSMGGVSLGNTDSTFVNTSNPASYSYIARHLPIFQLGLNGKLSTFSKAANSTKQRHFGLNQFQMGIPIKKNWGAGFGLKPYTFTGYTITEYEISGEDTTKQSISEGFGGIRIANFGLSYRPLNISYRDTIYRTEVDTSGNKYQVMTIGKRTHNVSVGVNGNYMFGASEKSRATEFLPLSSSPFNARVVDGIRVSGLTWEFGLNYQVGFKTTSSLRALSIGATFSPATEITSYQDLHSYSYIGSFYLGKQSIVFDTIEYIKDNKGIILKPESIGVGLEYRLSPRNSNSMLHIGVDLKMEKWSTFYTRFSDVNNSGGLKDRVSMGIGLEWTPKIGVSGLDKKISYLSKMKYRAGFNYTQTELLVKNNLGNDIAIDNYGMSFGLGLPIRTGYTNTNINFGASFGNLGTTENGLIQEKYMGLYVGLSITPQRTSRWFVKRKYN